MMFVVLWKYQVKPELRAEFAKIYAADGAWAELFKKSAGFLGTELLHDPDHPGHFITIDRWVSADAYAEFKSKWKTEYDSLDAQCSSLTLSESLIGHFSLIQPGG